MPCCQESACRLDPAGTEALTPEQVQLWKARLTTKSENYKLINPWVQSVKTMTPATRAGERQQKILPLVSL